MIESVAVGIDLGTTNSVVAKMDGQGKEIVCYQTKNGMKTIPSVVWCDPKNGEILVGKRAFDRKGTINEPIVSIKRLMGTQIRTKLGDEELLAQEISAYILKECKTLMESTLNSDSNNDVTYIVDRAVITVPAYFGLAAKEATKEAGKLAGLEILEILEEPSAASLYYSKMKDINGNFMVYDLGGGTFDVSIVQSMAGMLRVVGISGNNHLGGDNFDKRLTWHLIDRLNDAEEGYVLDLRPNENENDMKSFAWLLSVAESIKKELSDKEEVFCGRTAPFQDAQGVNVNINIDVQRQEFENSIDDLVESTIEECIKALEKSKNKENISLEDIDEILLVGGSSKIPLVQRRVKEEFCDKEISAKCKNPTVYEPDMSVGYGAAIRAFANGKKYQDESGVSVNVDLFSRTSKGLLVKGKVTGLESIELSKCKIIFKTEGLGEVGSCDVNNIGEYQAIIDTDGNKISNMIGYLNIPNQNEFVFTVGDPGELPPPPPMPVLSRDIRIDIYSKETGEIIKHTLMENGTQLPAKGEHIFYTNRATTQKMKLSIYEDSRILKETVITYNHKVVEGTPMMFNIFCSEKIEIEIKGEVDGSPFSVTIEPPPPPITPTMKDYENLIQLFDEKAALLSTGDLVKFRAKRMNICSNIEDAFKNNEISKLIEYMMKFEELIKQMVVVNNAGNEFNPPLEELQIMINQTRMQIPIAKMKVDLDDKGIIDSLNNIKEKLLQAYNAKDKKVYEGCRDELYQIVMYIRQIVMGGNKSEEPSPQACADDLKNQCDNVIRLCYQVMNSEKCNSSDKNTLANNISKLSTIKSSIPNQIELTSMEANEIRSALGVCESKARSIYKEMNMESYPTG